MAKIEGLNKIYTLLRNRSKKLLDGKTGGNPSVTVGFTQQYALYVHENLEAHHDVGQAKFLEQPAREMARDLAGIVADVVNNGGSLEAGLLQAGLELQSAAQELTPVDTSALKASAFTCLTVDEEAATAAAYSKGEAIRQAAEANKPQSQRGLLTIGKQLREELR